MNKVNLTQNILKLECPYANTYQGPRKRLLFVCSAGMLRSPTAAAVATRMGYNARSCGTGNYALIRLSANLIYWAEHIYFVNEENYHEALDLLKGNNDLLEELADKHTVWDIPDNYEYMNPDLVSILDNLLGAAPKF